VGFFEEFGQLLKKQSDTRGLKYMMIDRDPNLKTIKSNVGDGNEFSLEVMKT